jgi:hypothetical protein
VEVDGGHQCRRAQRGDQAVDADPGHQFIQEGGGPPGVAGLGAGGGGGGDQRLHATTV